MHKEVKFEFDGACMELFKCLKEKLISTPVIISIDCSEPFEVMCDASGTMMGVFCYESMVNYFMQSITQGKNLMVLNVTTLLQS